MPRRISASQFRSILRQAEAKQRQAIHRYNSEVRRHNSEQKRKVDELNRVIRRYNSAVSAYNSRRRTNYNRLKTELRRLANQPVTVRYTSLRRSSLQLTSAYEQLDEGGADPFLSDLAEREAANSVSVLNVLLGDEEHAPGSAEDLSTTRITELLTGFSEDLTMRWSGAIYALNPANPDAARHFCSSAREIIAEIINLEAPDEEVLARFPKCPTTDRGTPTRRAKVHFCLDRNGLANVYLESFVESNIKDLSILFSDLNAGTHGEAGKYSLEQLVAIKGRVEDAIHFICEIASQPSHLLN